MSDRALSTIGNNLLAELATWLDDQVRQKLKFVSLQLRLDSGVEQPVRELVLEGAGSVDVAAQGLLGRARSAARLQLGRSTFTVTSYDAQDRKVDLYVFNLSEEANPSSEQEKNNELTDMLMRHTEASARLSLGHTLQVVELYRDVIRMRDAEIERLNDVVERVEAKSERLMTLQWERDDKVFERQADREESNRRWETFQMGLPFLATLFSPQHALPGEGVFMDDLIEKLIATIRPEQVVRIASQLTDEQATIFGHIYNAYNQRGEARQKKKAAAANGTSASSSAPGSTAHAAA